MPSPPTASLLIPATGQGDGGTAFAIIGSNLAEASVAFGKCKATDVYVHDSGMLLVGLTPSRQAGVEVEVSVMTSVGSCTLPERFIYDKT
ncbi:IPT/TIG domain-containing protein [Streptomyces kronopolitis]